MLNDKQAKWLAENILPHESDVRRWLSKYKDIDADDILQEAWVILAKVDFTTIQFPRRLLFTITRNIVLQHYRRAQIVSFSSLADLSDECSGHDTISPEQSVGARKELEFLNHVISNLPPRCRAIFTLHRIHGYSHKECAQRLNLSETIIAKQVAKALRLIGDAYGHQERQHDIGYRSLSLGRSHNNRP